MLLADGLPELANELGRLFVKAGRPELAVQVPGLMIMDRCRCGEYYCSTFYTQPKHEGRYGPYDDGMDLDADEGVVLINLLAGAVARVEILHRDDIRAKLIAQLP